MGSMSIAPEITSQLNSGQNSISIVTPNPQTTITVVPNSQQCSQQCSNCSGNSQINNNSGCQNLGNIVGQQTFSIPHTGNNCTQGIKLDHDLCLEIKQALSGDQHNSLLGSVTGPRENLQSEIGRETTRESECLLSTGKSKSTK